MKKTNESTNKVFTFITTHRAKKGVSPTFAEIAAGLRFKSADTVTFHVKKLVAEGLLTKEAGTARGLVPTARIGVPVINTVRVERSDLLPQAEWEYLLVDEATFKKGPADWLVLVPNYAMLDEDLMRGDLVAVKKTKSFTAGHLICASQGNQILVGFGHVHDGIKYIYLRAEDKQGQPLYVNDDDVQAGKEGCSLFWGIVIGVIRRAIRVKPDFRREFAERQVTRRNASK